ncbi:MAG: hypothetical protein PW845_26675 [Pseudomonas sp.]|nr:hypothetical protein [Pseudomonas sp.]
MEKDDVTKLRRTQPVIQLFRTSPSLADRRKPAAGFSFADYPSKEQVIEALKDHLISDWHGLGSSARRAVGFKAVSQCSEEEDGLTHLAYLLIDCANRTLDQAVAVRRTRLMDLM